MGNHEDNGWLHVKRCMGDALDLDPSEREAYLGALDTKNPDLAGKVRSLLRSHLDAGTFMDGSTAALELAGRLETGDQIGPYCITGVLGEGGFSIVYEASQSKPIQRTVALKVIKPGMDSQQILTRFEGERQTLARMQHPGIATVLDGGSTPSGHPYFIMELVDGLPITSYCQKSKLGLVERLELFLQVCHAVQHAHQKGVVHRDLKPSNVLVEEGAQGPRVQVIDFGIAKSLHHDEESSLLLTQVGTFLGTPEYMSPEQARGDQQDLDTRSDVYSLGVLLYELLTGQRPFSISKGQTRSIEEFRHLICDVDPPKPSTKVSERSTAANESSTTIDDKNLRGDLDWIVMRAMEKERERRYPSAVALADDVERYMSFEPVMAGPPSSLYRVGKFARRNRGALAAMVGVVMALASGLGFAVIGMNEAQKQAGLAEDAKDMEEIARGKAEDALEVAHEQTMLAQTSAKEELKAREQTERALEEAETQKALALTAAESELQARREAESSLVEAQVSEDFLENMLLAAKPDSEEGDVTVLTVLDLAAQDLSTTAEFDTYPVVKARMHRVIAGTYRSLGALPKADEHIHSALAILEGITLEDPAPLLIAQGLLCTIRYDQSRHMEVAELIDEVANRSFDLFGENDELTLGAQSRLAGLYFETGNLADGIPLLQGLIPRQTQVFGSNDSRTISSLVNLATMFGAARRPAEALDYAERAVESSLAAHDPDHPRVLHSQHTLATVHMQSQRWKEAIGILIDLIDSRERILGEEHYETLGSVNYLALCYHQDRQTKLAEETYRKTLEVHERVLGPNHRQTMMCLHNLGMLLEQSDQTAKAEPVLKKAMDRIVSNRGPKHAEALQARYHYYALISDLGRVAEVEAKYTQTVTELLQEFQVGHPLREESAIHHAGIMRAYSKKLIERQELKEAERVLLQVIESWTALGREGYPGVLCTELVALYDLLENPEQSKLWQDRADSEK